MSAARFLLSFVVIGVVAAPLAFGRGDVFATRTQILRGLPEYVRVGGKYFNLPKDPPRCGESDRTVAAAEAQFKKATLDVQEKIRLIEAKTSIDFKAFEQSRAVQSNREKARKTLDALTERRGRLHNMLEAVAKLQASYAEFELSCMTLVYETEDADSVQTRVTENLKKSAYNDWLTATLRVLEADLPNLQRYIEFETNPLAFVEDFEPTDAPLTNNSVLEDFLNKEAAKREDSRIQGRALGLLDASARRYAQREEEALSNYNEAQASLASATEKLRETRDALERNPGSNAEEFRSAQDKYANALSQFRNYFDVKRLDDDERENHLANIERRLASERLSADGARQLDEKRKTIELLQEANLRSAAREPLDSFGLTKQGEQEKDLRSDSEKALWKQLNESDDWFDKNYRGLSRVSLLIKLDSSADAQTQVQSPESLANLKNHARIIQSVIAQTGERLHNQSQKYRADETDTAALEVLRARGYDPYLALLILKGSAMEYVEADEIIELRNDRDVIVPLLEAIDQFSKVAAQNRKEALERERALRLIADSERAIEEAKVRMVSERANRNLFAYMSLSSAMLRLSADIRAIRAKDKSADVRDLQVAFLSVMHRLEILEFQLASLYRGEEPYPRASLKTWVKDAVKNAGATITRVSNIDLTNPKRPSKQDLMLDYQWALHGTTWAQAFARELEAKLISFKNSVWNVKGQYQSFIDYFQYKNLSQMLGQTAQMAQSIDRFATKNPILAADLTRNLTHTYLILNQLGNLPYQTSTVGQFITDVKIIYQIKEVENIARDWLLGTEPYLYSNQNLDQPVSESALLLVGAAEKAPYLAGALVGAYGVGTIPSWSQSFVEWIPVIGSWKPLKIAAGALGGVGQVEAQNWLAAKISYDHERLANMLRRGFESFYANPPKTPTQIAKEMVGYQIARSLIRSLGTIRKKGLKETLKDAAECVKRNPGAVGGGAAVGVAVGIGAGCAALTASAVAAPLVLPPLIAVGVIVGSVAVVDAVLDRVRPERKFERELQRWKTSLEKVQLPTNGVPELNEVQQEWMQDNIPKVLGNIRIQEVKARADAEVASTREAFEPVMQRHLTQEIDDQLAKLELEHAEAIQEKVIASQPDFATLPDPELKAFKERLNAVRNAWGLRDVTPLLAAARAAADKLENDTITDGIKQRLDEVAELLNPPRPRQADPARARKIFDQTLREVNVLRVHQMQEGVANAYSEFQEMSR